MRNIVLSNGNMLIALDENASIKDFYYPYVGEENHTIGRGHRIGIWTEGTFTWIGDNEHWARSVKYVPDTLVSDFTFRNDKLELELDIKACVDRSKDAYISKMTVKNLAGRRRDVKVFFSHDYRIKFDQAADTAVYIEDLGALVHYKRDRYFLHAARNVPSQFACGNKELRRTIGTWVDAEDGELAGGRVAHGSVDSVLGYTLEMTPDSSQPIEYYIVAGVNMSDVISVHRDLQDTQFDDVLSENEKYWADWCTQQEQNFWNLSNRVQTTYYRSLLVMRAHTDNRGAIIASCDSAISQFNMDYYSYCWPRDAAWVVMAYDSAGYHELSRRFFRFAAGIISDRGVFHHKYWASGSVGSTWHPHPSIQIDETGIVLAALLNHYEKVKDLDFVLDVFDRLIVPAANFLSSEFIGDDGLPKESWDLWEERFGVFAYSTACVYCGLKAAAFFANLLGRRGIEKAWDTASQGILDNFSKFYDGGDDDGDGDDEHGSGDKGTDGNYERFLRNIKPRDKTIDASLFAIFYFGLSSSDDERVQKTMNAVRTALFTGFGLTRYENDRYQGNGNVWPITTLFFVQWLIAKAKSPNELEEAARILDEVASLATESGLLAEQYDAGTRAPRSVCPLVWSHSQLVMTVNEYLKKLEGFKLAFMDKL